MAKLTAARQLRDEVISRRPQRSVRSAAKEKGGSCVNRESGGHLSMSVLGHPNAAAEAVVDINFYDTWRADVSFAVHGFGTGLLPMLALLREPDLVPDYLPKQPGLPYLERLEMVQEWGPNDWAYHCFVCPFGPLPGADDIHNFLLFDCMDESDPCIMAYAVSPPEGDDVYRGWSVPSVKGWRRKRNYVLGATTVVRPSTARVLEIDPPTEQPSRCSSPGCPFWAHSCLSVGGGRYCCHKCRLHPGKHSSHCERIASEGEATAAAAKGGATRRGSKAAKAEAEPQEPPAWQLAKHGTIDIEIHVNVKLPIPTFLIPLSLVRWVIPKLLRLIYPYMLLLNERFEATPFAQRVRDDAHGFYSAVAQTLNATCRRCNSQEHDAGSRPRFAI